MTPYTAPGLGLDEARIIDLIRFEFDLPDTSWVRSKSRETHIKIARQLLMTCLIDHLGYTLAQSGAVCLLDHATAKHAHNMIIDQLWFDRQYGERILCVYNRCIEEKRGVMRRIIV